MFVCVVKIIENFTAFNLLFISFMYILEALLFVIFGICVKIPIAILAQFRAIAF